MSGNVFGRFCRRVVLNQNLFQEKFNHRRCLKWKCVASSWEILVHEMSRAHLVATRNAKNYCFFFFAWYIWLRTGSQNCLPVALHKAIYDKIRKPSKVFVNFKVHAIAEMNEFNQKNHIPIKFENNVMCDGLFSLNRAILYHYYIVNPAEKQSPDPCRHDEFLFPEKNVDPYREKAFSSNINEIPKPCSMAFICFRSWLYDPFCIVNEHSLNARMHYATS